MSTYWSVFVVTMVVWGGSEGAIGRVLRARATGGGTDHDQRSFWVLWGTIGGSCFVAGWLSAFRVLPFPVVAPWGWMGLGLVWAGLALRWTAILTLRRFFTVDVAIRADHRVVDSGVYAWIRHPSYTGALVSFMGLGVALQTWPGLLLTTVPIVAAFLHRIRIEEAALAEALGSEWTRYASRTRRLLPGLY